MPEVQKVYCYADETGADTEGRLFIVGVVLVDGASREDVEERMVRLERRSGRVGSKWTHSTIARRRLFLREMATLGEAPRYAWEEWTQTGQYPERMADAVARACAVVSPGAHVTVIVDGLKESERGAVAAALGLRRVRYRKIRLDCRDESYPLLRLADAVAGFLRDVREGETYAVALWPGVQHLFLKL